MRSGGLYRLPTWERPTSGSDCSYWPTVAVGGNHNRRGASSTAAQEFWPTPNVPNGGRSMSAEDVAAKGKTAQGKRQVQLENVAKFHSEEVCSRPDPATETAGSGSSPPTRRLNPLFVEMLMGLPPGWVDAEKPIALTNYAVWAMASCRSVRRLHGGSCSTDCMDD